MDQQKYLYKYEGNVVNTETLSNMIGVSKSAISQAVKRGYASTDSAKIQITIKGKIVYVLNLNKKIKSLHSK